MPQYLDKTGLEYYTQELKKKLGELYQEKGSYVTSDTEQNITATKQFDERPQLNSSLVQKSRSSTLPPYLNLITLEDIPSAGFEDILEGVIGKTKVEWNALNASEYGSNSTYNGATLPPVMLESSSSFWNSASGRPLDISFHFAKQEKMAILQVKCLPYGGASPTMTVYYAQEGDTELTLYKEIATISTGDRKTYEFNEEGISADYWVVRFTASGWIDLRLCKPGSSFTPGLYSEVFHQQIMDKLNGYQPVGNYALQSDLPTKLSQLTNDSNYLTKTNGDGYYQEKGDYALKSELPTVPTKVSELDNDVNYTTSDDVQTAIETYMSSHYENGNKGSY